MTTIPTDGDVAGPVHLRRMAAEDVPAVLDIQEPSAVAGLSDVFPQDSRIRGDPGSGVPALRGRRRAMGSGTAQAAHEALLALLRARGVQQAWLLVFTDNRRGRRFYERLGWRPNGERTRSAFPPYAELLRYERDLDDG